MTSKLARITLKIGARNSFAQKTLDWLRLLIVLAMVLSLAFASWAPNGLVLPVYYIVSLLLVIALPRSRDRVLVAALCT
ncbi:MAG TPA: hypothetical protein VFY96_16280, partial [Candidatus Binatia bacterium]|nr:hypothetical protein [Candidatus Binatia bacterium]